MSFTPEAQSMFNGQFMVHVCSSLLSYSVLVVLLDALATRTQILRIANDLAMIIKAIQNSSLLQVSIPCAHQICASHKVCFSHILFLSAPVLLQYVFREHSIVF